MSAVVAVDGVINNPVIDTPVSTKKPSKTNPKKRKLNDEPNDLDQPTRKSQLMANRILDYKISVPFVVFDPTSPDQYYPVKWSRSMLIAHRKTSRFLPEFTEGSDVRSYCYLGDVNGT